MDDTVADLLGWVPDRANAALFIDANAIQKTDMVVRLKWAGQMGPTYGLESLPPIAARLVVGCQIDLNGGMDWEMGVAAQRKRTTDAEFAKANGGKHATVGGKSVVVIEKHGIAATLAPGVVTAHQPPNRQESGRWLRAATGKAGPGMSPYLKQAAALVGLQTPAVLAFDTTDLLPAAKIKGGLDNANRSARVAPVGCHWRSVQRGARQCAATTHGCGGVSRWHNPRLSRLRCVI
ncbi:hypothetical protein [Urbifossiella limnaea]|uniref:Uncharacterized protein n=1 Tax=Urbifossiella limnaea TaxID=2528023 RepID=A0A517XWY3_9BACT|nr:hypothetical protein [Urbifossiella limnaea]QDU21998.1 hypothetical protein ETAA1_39730 [Urbifossiella limnaea]